MTGRRIGSRRALSALAGVLAGLTLPAMVLVMPAAAGEAVHGGAASITSWVNGFVAPSVSKPSGDVPPIGTILSGGGKTASSDLPRPTAEMLAAPQVKAAKELRESLTDSQKKQIAGVMNKYAEKLKSANGGLPKPSVDAPSSKSTDKAPARVDPSSLAATTAQLRSITSQLNDDIRDILTPEQRDLFDKSVPDLKQLDSVPLPSTATLKAASTDEASDTTSVKSSKDDSDKEVKRTATEKQQHERTNTAGLDEYHTEGNIVGVRCAADQPVPDIIHGPVSFNVDEAPYAVLATKDGLQQVRLLNDTSGECGTLKSGDYLSVDGVKQNEFLFDAEELSSEPSVLR
jgi:hypothetical protein